MEWIKGIPDCQKRGNLYAKVERNGHMYKVIISDTFDHVGFEVYGWMYEKIIPCYLVKYWLKED